MKILVTGANGYMGQGIVKQLLDDGMEVVATDFRDDVIDARAEIMLCDLFAVEDPYEYFGHPDAVLHLAWKDGFKHASLAHMTDLNHHYMFLKSCVEGGIKQLCCLGSVHEVGFYEGSVSESTPTNPQSLYGISKNALRQSIELLKKEHDFVFQWIRGYYIVGNSEHGCSIFSKITQAEKEGKETFPFTTGENQFDFIDYDTFCLQVASVVEQTEVTGIINCCHGRPNRLGERVEQFIQEMGYQIKLEYGVFPERPYDSKAVWGDSRKIEQIMKLRK